MMGGFVIPGYFIYLFRPRGWVNHLIDSLMRISGGGSAFFFLCGDGFMLVCSVHGGLVLFSSSCIYSSVDIFCRIIEVLSVL